MLKKQCLLEEHYIHVSYKTFTSWLRNGEIPAIASDNRKEGWAIRKEDIFAFADKKRPGLRGYWRDTMAYWKTWKK